MKDEYMTSRLSDIVPPNVNECLKESKLNLEDVTCATGLPESFSDFNSLHESKTNVQFFHSEDETLRTPDIYLSNSSFREKLFGLSSEEMDSALMQEFQIDKNEHQDENSSNTAQLLVTGNCTIEKAELPQVKKQHLLGGDSNSTLSSPISSTHSDANQSNNITSPTNSLSSIDTVLKNPCTSKAGNFLSSRRIKRKKIIFCCVE
ncbi:hypothetical protein TKK_0005466 [Trichogramma kaykai]|uniref:Uncharacterized protein n=1 Tax=Trichogramma kaykai TaxID=54128 RepID=A0ABD2XIP1_9HYME